MQYFENCRVAMTVKDIVCNSITMHAQGCPWFAMWSLDFMKVMRGPIVLTMLCEYTQDIEEVYIYIYIYIYIDPTPLTF